MLVNIEGKDLDGKDLKGFGEKASELNGYAVGLRREPPR